MADFSIPINVPDDKVSDVLDALRDRYEAPAATAGQIKTLFTADVQHLLKSFYTEYLVKQRDLANPVDATIDLDPPE